MAINVLQSDSKIIASKFKLFPRGFAFSVCIYLFVTKLEEEGVADTKRPTGHYNLYARSEFLNICTPCFLLWVFQKIKTPNIERIICTTVVTVKIKT